MSDEILKRDQNRITVLGGITDDADEDIVMLRVDPITKRLKISVDYGDIGILVNGALVLAPDFVDSATLEYEVTGSDVSGNVIGVDWIVVSASQTAVLGQYYIVDTTSTFTDPTPAQGKGFTVLVRNGTATVGGTAYATAGTLIKRYYHSGAWANYVYVPQGNMSGDATQAPTGVVTIASNAVTNGKLAQMPAYTIKSNTTNATAVAADNGGDTINHMLNVGPSVSEVAFLYNNATSTDVLRPLGQVGSSVLGTLAIVTDRLLLGTFYEYGSRTIERLAIEVTANTSITSAIVAIYTPDTDGLPRFLVHQEQITVSGTGVFANTGLNIKLPAGQYFAAVIVNGTGTLRATQFSQSFGQPSSGGTAHYRCFQYTFTFGTLGNLSTSSLSWNTGNFPTLWAGYSALTTDVGQS